MISTLFSWFKPSPKEENFDHKINADISVVPLGTPEGSSISKYTKEAGKILARSGFREISPHAFGTNVSGNWTELKSALEKIAEDQLNRLKVPRLSVNLKISFRKDKDQSIGARLAKA